MFCNKLILIHAIFASIAMTSTAFQSSPTRRLSPSIGLANIISSSQLSAKKRRRRREDEEAGNDLPDFEIRDEQPPEKKTTPSNTNAAAKMDPNEITDAMMGSANMPVRSVRELLRDRSLEKKLEFDKAEEDEAIPDFTQLAQQSLSTGSSEPAMGGKKRARQEARRAAAQAKAEEESAENILSKVPFVTDEKGEVKPVKVLEAGAWIGIFLLVAWELYINSPFFERVAPMAPVVY